MCLAPHQSGICFLALCAPPASVARRGAAQLHRSLPGVRVTQSRVRLSGLGGPRRSPSNTQCAACVTPRTYSSRIQYYYDLNTLLDTQCTTRNRTRSINIYYMYMFMLSFHVDYLFEIVNRIRFLLSQHVWETHTSFCYVLCVVFCVSGLIHCHCESCGYSAYFRSSLVYLHRHFNAIERLNERAVVVYIVHTSRCKVFFCLPHRIFRSSSSCGDANMGISALSHCTIRCLVRSDKFLGGFVGVLGLCVCRWMAGGL